MSEDDVRAAPADAAGETTSVSDGSQLSEEDVSRLENERDQRLADENRPDGAEVDNTARDFDSEAGKFTDSPGYDPHRRPYDDDAGEGGAARAAHSSHDEDADGSTEE